MNLDPNPSLLTDASELMRQILEDLEVGIVVYDKDLRWIARSKCLERLTGVPNSQVLGRRVLDQWPELKDYGFIESLKRVLAGETVTMEPVLHIRGGNRMLSRAESSVVELDSKKLAWLRWTFVPRRKLNGEIIGAVGLQLDVTQEILAKHQSTEAINKYQALVEQLPAITFSADAEYFKTTYVSPQIESLLGYTPQEWVADPDCWVKCLHPDDKQRVIQEVTNAHAALAPFDSTYRMVARDGNVRWFHDRSRITALEGATHQEVHGLLLDITDRRAAEEALRRSNERFDLLVRGTNEGVWDWNVSTGEAYFSERAHEILGYHPGDLGARMDAWITLLHPDDVEHVNESLRQHFKTRGQYLLEFRARAKWGEYRWLRSRGQAIWDDNGRATRMVGSFADITDQKKVEEEFRKQQAGLAHAQRLASVGEISTLMTHELSQPLTALLSYTSAASKLYGNDINANKELKDILDRVDALARRAADVVRTVRGLVRREDGSDQLLNVHDLIRDTARLIEAESANRNVKLKFDLQAENAQLRGQRGPLQQLILNLMINALDAMESMPAKRRKLTVSTEDGPERQIMIGVSDTGPGFTDELEKTMFDAFVTTKPDGLGLGLSICRTIVENHGGRLIAKRNSDRGATFFVMLPIAEG